MTQPAPRPPEDASNASSSPPPAHSTTEPTQPSEHDQAEPLSAPDTGLALVDEVLARIEGVGELPLELQVAAFEQAHSDLRAALDAPAATAE